VLARQVLYHLSHVPSHQLTFKSCPSLSHIHPPTQDFIFIFKKESTKQTTHAYELDPRCGPPVCDFAGRPLSRLLSFIFWVCLQLLCSLLNLNPRLFSFSSFTLEEKILHGSFILKVIKN
jgi:hypothetical protein